MSMFWRDIGRIRHAMSSLILVVSALGAAAHAQSLRGAPAAQGSGCAKPVAEWGALKGTTDASALRRFLSGLPATCPDQRREAQARLNLVEANAKRVAEQLAAEERRRNEARTAEERRLSASRATEEANRANAAQREKEAKASEERRLAEARIEYKARPLLKAFDDVRGASFSRDGQRVVTATSFTWAKVWDVITGDYVLGMNSPEFGIIRSAAFSPDGSRVVAAFEKSRQHFKAKTVFVWDVTVPPRGELVFALDGHTEGAWSASYSPDGSRIVTASDDKTACIWDAETGRLRTTLRGHSGPVTSAAFSPDGERVVTGSIDGSIRIWNARTGGQLLKISASTGSVAAAIAIFSPDGSRVFGAPYFSGPASSTGRVWDAATGKPVFTLGETGSYFVSATYSPDGSRIATAASDGKVVVWDARNGEPLETLKDNLYKGVSVAYSPDGSRIVVGLQSREAYIWTPEKR